MHNISFTRTHVPVRQACALAQYALCILECTTLRINAHVHASPTVNTHKIRLNNFKEHKHALPKRMKPYERRLTDPICQQSATRKNNVHLRLSIPVFTFIILPPHTSVSPLLLFVSVEERGVLPIAPIPPTLGFFVARADFGIAGAARALINDPGDASGLGNAIKLLAMSRRGQQNM